MKHLLILLLLLPTFALAQSPVLTSEVWVKDYALAKADSGVNYVTPKGLADGLAGVSGGSLPSGMIVMWSGLIANIPTGWHLCDGTNGTPDLRGRFVKGALAGVEAGGTGGDSLHTPAGTNAAPALTMNAYTPAGTVGSISATATGAVKIGTSSTTAAANSHTHPAPTFTGTQATLTGSVAAPGFTGTQANYEPAYFSICFIMKL